MLLSLDDYLHAKNLRYQLSPSRDINDWRVLQSDCTRTQLATHNQKGYYLMLPSLVDYFHANTLQYQLILSREIDDQRNLKSTCTRSTNGRILPKVVVSDSTFLWWFWSKIYKVWINSFHKYWWSKNNECNLIGWENCRP